MKTRVDVTAAKLRGGFYTPRVLVEACLARIVERLPNNAPLRVLEPSVGDGAFIRGLDDRAWRTRIEYVRAVERLEIEAEKARYSLRDAALPGGVAVTSAIAWAATTTEQFDVAVGNPPFVRYQFIDEGDRAAILDLGARLGIEFAGVANLWIPLLTGALSRVRPGGAFAFVIPTECLTGCSAALVRQWLINECSEIRFDLFAPGSFPDVLQEVLILSGTRGLGNQHALPVHIVEHGGSTRNWSYTVSDPSAWTRYLLDPPHLEALEEASKLPMAEPLGKRVAFEVSIVTGANDFFSVDDKTLTHYELEPWARPLLARVRHSPGLIVTEKDTESVRDLGGKRWLLDFAADRPDPLASRLPAAYLRLGRKASLHTRYKCRIREPWYRVPGIVRGELLLSKRSHHWPRVIVNEQGVYTTDTIYRGRMLTRDRTPRDMAAAFHNSLTLLTAELEGRSFGGGVLELVPSEIARLTTLVPRHAATALSELDLVARTHPQGLVEKTDAYLVSVGALDRDLLPSLQEARELLAARRLDRNRRAAADSGVHIEATAA